MSLGYIQTLKSGERTQILSGHSKKCGAQNKDGQRSLILPTQLKSYLAPWCHASATHCRQFRTEQEHSASNMPKVSKHCASVPMMTQKQEVPLGLLDASN